MSGWFVLLTICAINAKVYNQPLLLKYIPSYIDGSTVLSPRRFFKQLITVLPELLINSSISYKMLLRTSVSIFRRCVHPWTPNCKVTHLKSWNSMFPLKQVASIVSISGFKTGGNPRTSTHVLFESPEESTLISVAGFQIGRNPYTPIQVSEGPGKSATSPKPEYISVLFCEGDGPADVAWTFAIRNGEDLIKTLQRYARKMRRGASDEYRDAFQRFATELIAQRLPLDQGDKILENADIPLEHPTGKAKNIESIKRLPGEARDKVIELGFRQGQSPVDLAIFLDRTPEFILRKAKCLLGKYGLEKQMRWNKKGQWTNIETQWLISRRNQGLPLNKMAKLLRRTRQSVEKTLRQLGTEILKSAVVVEEGPQELPSWLREMVFTTRLIKIWKGLLKSDMTPIWREALSKKSSKQWLTRTSEGIPKDVKKILGGLRPPTFDELEHLSPINSTDAGVYARLVTSRYPVLAVSDRYLYVGSASKYGSGLQGRAEQHIKKGVKTRLGRNIKKMNLKVPGSFVVLMTIKMNSAEEEHILDVRRTATLAEAILTIWLGALQSPSPQLQKLCPWDPQALDYTAWSSHNPLTVDIVLPNSPMIGKPV